MEKLRLRSGLETTLLSNEQSKKPEKCALIAVLTVPSSATCSCPSQTKDEEGNQRKHICIRSQFTLERVQMLCAKWIQIIVGASPIKITPFLFFSVGLITYTYKQICSLCIDFMDKRTYSHTHKRKNTEATINYSHPIWEH